MKNPLPFKKHFFARMLFGAALWATGSIAGFATGESISINFGGTNVTTDSAGAVLVDAAKWNNATNTGTFTNDRDDSGTLDALIDSTGATTGLSVTWSSANTYYSAAATTTGNGQLTKRYLDDSGTGARVTISNVAYFLSNVYVIVGSDQGATANYRPYSVNGTWYTGAAGSTVAGSSAWSGKGYENDATLTQGTGGSYLQISGIANSTITVQGASSGSGRGPIAGVQVENAYSGNLIHWAGSNNTWDTGSSWKTNGTGTEHAWGVGTNQIAVFDSSLSMSVSGTQLAEGLWLKSGVMSLADGAVSLTGIAVMRIDTGSTLTFTTTDISGTDFSVQGGGNVIFDNATAHSYSGTMTIAGGTTLQVGTGGTTGTLGNQTTVNNGTLIFNRSAETTVAGMLSGAGAIQLDGAGAVALTAGNVSGVISGTGALKKTGTDALTLSGVNIYSGGTTVNGGTLVVANAKALGTGGTTVATGGQLNLEGSYNATDTGNVRVEGGTLALKSGTTFSVNKAGGLTFAGTDAKLTTSNGGTATVKGYFDVNSASISVATGTAGAVIETGITLVNGGNYGLRMDVDGDITVKGTIAATGDANATDSGKFAGFFKKGTGNLTLTGTASFTTALSLQNGTMTLAGGDDRLVTNIIVYTGGSNNTSGTLALAGINQTIAGLEVIGTGTANAVVGASATLSTLTVNNTANHIYSGKIGGTGTNQNNLALVKSGEGKLTLSGSNTYTGGTTINAGTLSVANANALGTGTTSINAGTLELQNGVVFGKNITFAGNNTVLTAASGAAATVKSGGDVNSQSIFVAAGVTGAVFEANITLASGGNWGFRMDVAGEILVKGGITASGSVNNAWTSNKMISFIKRGAGNLTLTGFADIQTGLSLQEGTFTLSGSDDRLSSNTIVYLGSKNNTNGTLALAGVNQTISGLEVEGTGTTSAVVGASATQSTLTINNTATNNYVYSGKIGGTGTNQNNIALTKSGEGTFTLSNVNTYTGATTIETGKLLLANTGSIAESSSIIVKSGAAFDVTGKSGFTIGSAQTLGGNGTVDGAVTINGTLSPGESVGTITFTDAITITETGKIIIEIDSADSYDKIIAAAGLTFLDGAQVELAFVGYSATLDDSFNIFGPGSGAISGLENADITSNLSGYTFDWNGGALKLISIPEPSTYALIGGLAALGLAVIARRNRRKQA